MKIQINRHTILIYITIIVITLSESTFFYNRGLNNVLEYLGYGLLLPSIFFSFIKEQRSLDKRKDLLSFLIVLSLTGIGLWFQNISMLRFFVLQFTVVAIAIISTLSSNYLFSLKVIRGAAYSLLIGIIFATFLGLIGGDGVWDYIKMGEGIYGIPLGLNGGIVFKNYFAADILIIYICLSIYGRCEKYKSVDKVAKVLCVLLCILSNSRGGILLLVVYWISLNYSLIFKFTKKYRKPLVLGIVIIGWFLFMELYNSIIAEFSTYAYRFRGLINYLNYYAGESFYMIFGNAESFYDKNMSYVMAVRSTTGFDGSLEIAWLNIVIKSGFLGIVAYAIIFVRMFRVTARIKNRKMATCMVALTLTYLASSLVEVYIQSIHCIFGVLCYLVVNGLYGNERRMRNRIDVGY